MQRGPLSHTPRHSTNSNRDGAPKPGFDLSEGPQIVKQRMQRRRDRSLLLESAPPGLAALVAGGGGDP